MNVLNASRGFAAVGAASRLMVLRKLLRAGRGGLSVGGLQRGVKIPASTLAHHLRCLVDAGLVVQKKDGREVINVVNFKRVKALADFLLSECCVDSESDESCF